MRDIQKLYEAWLSHEEMPKDLKKELKAMKGKAIEDAFFQDLQFGTAGMRGILGPGTNRINIFTIRRAALAFGKYLIKAYPDAQKRGVVIAYDNRHKNTELMIETSRTLRSIGIRTCIFDELKPTPLLSFAVRHLNCIGGVMITASHNPKNYNGFKVYDDTGSQLTPEKVDLILKEFKELPELLDIKVTAPTNGYALLSDDTEETYFKNVLDIQINPNLDRKGYRIVFSPQHGAGAKLGMRALNVIGYDVIKVLDQMEPNPNFPNTKSPNPEDKAAYIEAIKNARAHGAHLIITTDPDADRLGLAYRNKKGSFSYLTGNEGGALLIDYILKHKKERGELHQDSYLYTTIVTSTLGSKIAESYGVNVKEFLTGFKFIGTQIALDDLNKVDRFVFGYEESYGCLVAPFVRDKDAIQALVLYSEMALYHHLAGKTLDVVLEELAVKHGYHHDVTKSYEFIGAAGQAKLQAILSNLRNNAPTSLGGLKVVQYDDYLVSKRYINGKEEELTLPESDVLRFYLEGGSTVSIRPSGTEPKCKIYYGIISENKKSAEALLKPIDEQLAKLFT
ncbi:MAG TPA: phospho-sugar mutase [Bacilli bacterium]|nr:phospho-sugar mutase [Bacilli bacterium]